MSNRASFLAKPMLRLLTARAIDVAKPITQQPRSQHFGAIEETP
jgi:hypothetical protein